MPTHTLTLSGHPAKLNELLGHRMKAHRLKKRDREWVALEAKNQEVPRATGPRRVSLEIILGHRQRAGDPDCYWKSLLDALVTARMLLNDNRQYCTLGTVTFSRAKVKQTTITLEDL
jgi:hypothetical protein